MSYNNILVISDNINICKSFNDIISRKNYENIQISFGTSPFSDSKLFQQELKKNLTTYDLKNEKDVSKIIAKHDLVFSIHCKQLFPKELVHKVKCINVHPGYNPINRGWYPQVFSIINDTPIGATIHEIDEELDNGLIIARDFVEKKMSDTSESLYNRVVLKEVELLEQNLDSIIKGNYEVIKPEGKGNLYLKKDFNQLCKIDLSENTTMLKAINKLRALTHGSYSNTYFIDKKTGKKIYIKISLDSYEE